VNPGRAAFAAALGAAFRSPDAVTPAADLVVHASGSPDGLNLALRIAGFESTVVEMSWYGDATVSIPRGEAFHAGRLTVKSSQVGTIAPAQRPRWDPPRRMQLALRLLASPVLDAVITGDTPFETLPAVMAQLATAPAGTLCHRVTYGDRESLVVGHDPTRGA
jgi:threonine dehydrogenase-like Zn-dependent dehydrogenase